MRVLLDTNVVLDVLLNRETWVKDSAAVWQASDQGRIIGHITATTLTDIFYVSRRLADLDVIVTRNKDDFETASTPALSPSEFIAQLSQPSRSAPEEDQ